MRILVIEDRKPGHFRKSRAIAEILAGLVPGGATLDTVAVRPRWFAHELVRRALARSTLAPSTQVRIGYGITLPPFSPGDVVVSSGRPTLLAGVAAARAGARYIYLGPAHGYDPDAFFLILTRDTSGPGRRVRTPAATPVDPGRFPPPRPLRERSDLRGASAALLVGGDSHDHRFSPGDWAALRAIVRDTAASDGLTWAVTTSRRTPDAAADGFAALAADLPEVTFIDYRTAGPGSIDALLGADLIAVTSDSSSMIADAVAAMRPVLALDPSTSRRGATDATLARHAASGQLARRAMLGLDADAFAEAVVGLRPPSTSPRDGIRRVLAEAFGYTDPAGGNGAAGTCDRDRI